MTNGKKDQFSTILDINSTEHTRIKKFAGAMGYASLREFIKQAIYEKMQNDLDGITPGDRQAVLRLIRS